MIRGDLEKKCEKGRVKIDKAVELNKGFTIMATGITADDCRIALASVNAGVRIIEVNHPSVCLSMGLYCVTTMRAAEENRHRRPL